MRPGAAAQQQFPMPHLMDQIITALHAIDRVVFQNVHATLTGIALERQVYELAMPKRYARRRGRRRQGRGVGGAVAAADSVPETLIIEWSFLYTCTFLCKTLQNSTNLQQSPSRTAETRFVQLVRGYKQYYLKLLSTNISCYSNLGTLVVFMSMSRHRNYKNYNSYSAAANVIRAEEEKQKSTRTFAHLVHNIVMGCTKTLQHLILVDYHYPVQILYRELHFAKLLSKLNNLHTLFVPDMYHLYAAYGDGRINYMEAQTLFKDLLQTVPPEKRLPNLQRLVMYDTPLSMLEVRSKHHALLLSFPSAKCVVECGWHEESLGEESVRKIFPQFTSVRPYLWGRTKQHRQQLRSYETNIENRYDEKLNVYIPFKSTVAREKLAQAHAERAHTFAMHSRIVGPQRAHEWAASAAQQYRFYFKLEQYIRTLAPPRVTTPQTQQQPTNDNDDNNNATAAQQLAAMVALAMPPPVAPPMLTNLDQLSDSSGMLARVAQRHAFAVCFKFNLFRNLHCLEGRVVERALSPWASNNEMSSNSLATVHIRIKIDNRKFLKELSGNLLAQRRLGTVSTGENHLLGNFQFDCARVHLKIKQSIGSFTLRCKAADALAGTYDREVFKCAKRTITNVANELFRTVECHYLDDDARGDFLSNIFKCTRKIRLSVRWRTVVTDSKAAYDALLADSSLKRSCKNQSELEELAEGMLACEELRAKAEFRKIVADRWFKLVERAPRAMPNLRRVELQWFN